MHSCIQSCDPEVDRDSFHQTQSNDKGTVKGFQNAVCISIPILLVFLPHVGALTYPMVETMLRGNKRFTSANTSYSTSSLKEKMVSRTCNETLVTVSNSSKLLIKCECISIFLS